MKKGFGEGGIVQEFTEGRNCLARMARMACDAGMPWVPYSPSHCAELAATNTESVRERNIGSCESEIDWTNQNAQKPLWPDLANRTLWDSGKEKSLALISFN